MKRARLIGVMVGAVVVLTAAGCSTTVESPESDATAESEFVDANDVDLTGTWESENRVVLRDGAWDAETSETLEITDVQDGLFKATRTVTLGTPGDFETGEGEVMTAVLESHGVINPDGTITIVKKGEEAGEAEGWLLSDNEMELIYHEGGEEPVVVRETLRRSAS